MITAKIIKDSISVEGKKRLVTLECTYPRYIHAEIMTHRVFSRNVASSRAIPVNVMIDKVMANPVKPIWMANQKGMQADTLLSGEDIEAPEYVWGRALESALLAASTLSALGIHKQIANRVLEPFSYTTSIISSTEWSNFFRLRLALDAQQEIQELARAISIAMDESKPNELSTFDWHLPYLTDTDIEKIDDIDKAKKISVARCARVSYLTHTNTSDFDKDLELFERLVLSGHMSPLEHVATPDNIGSGNFIGWKQLRNSYEEK